MTRRTKRGIEGALNSLEDDSTPSINGPRVDDLYKPAVATFIKRIGRDLFRIAAATAANVSESEPTERFLENVRERYDLTNDRDDEVRRELERIASDSSCWTPIDSFGTTPMALAANGTLETSDGTTLSQLVRMDRKDEAAHLLVTTAYDALADRGAQLDESAVRAE